MRKTLTIVLSAFVFLTTIAQEKEKRAIDSFSNINVASGIDLYLTQGNSVDLEVVCSKDDLHRLITEVQGSTLKIYMKGNNSWSWNSKNTPKVYLTFEQLEAINASGGSDVYGQNTITLADFKITASGGADIYMDVNIEQLKMNTSGGSDIKIKGTTNTMHATASGGSDINARELKAQKVTVNSSGGADATVWAEREIIANASGGSDITYIGNPQHKQLNESGAGDISHR